MQGKDFVITDDPSIIPYQEFTYTIPVGGLQDLFMVFKYFRVISQAGGALSVRFGQNGSITPFTGQGIGVNIGLLYPRITLFNTGATPLVITVALSIGDITDDRLNVSGVLTTTNVGTVLASVANATVTTSAASILAADSTRFEAILQNLDAVNTIYIGDSNINNTTRFGKRLLPGETIVLTTQAQVFAISSAGSPLLSILLNDYS